jgi:hypothetical protein
MAGSRVAGAGFFVRASKEIRRPQIRLMKLIDIINY